MQDMSIYGSFVTGCLYFVYGLISMAMAKFPLWFEGNLYRPNRYYFVERPSFISDFVRPA